MNWATEPGAVDYLLEAFTNSGGTGSPAASSVQTDNEHTFTGLAAGTYYVRVTPNDNVNPDPSCSLNSVIVTSAGDTEAPTLASAAIENANSSRIVLTYNEALDPFTQVDASKVSVSINGSPVTITAGNVLQGYSSNQVWVNLPSSVTAGQTVVISYSPGASGDRIRDVAQNFAAGFTNQAVTNNVV